MRRRAVLRDTARVETATARGIAHDRLLGQRTRAGALLIDHVERVAAAVPPEARPIAFLHDVLERSSTGYAELVEQGLTDIERAALELLTRGDAEPYEEYIQRIAGADGPAGDLARTVKLADLDDNLGNGTVPAGAPPYASAQQRIVAAAAPQLPEPPPRA